MLARSLRSKFEFGDFMKPHLPQLFDKYHPLAQLGRGGMADVYLAASQGPDSFSKLTVLKVLRVRLAHDQRYLEMFRQEARLSARLNHPNVVQTYEVGEHNGRPYLAMEYLEGQPLSQVAAGVGRGRGLSVSASLRIVIDLLSGLDYVHELTGMDGAPLGIVHRDITPQNIFVTYEGQVKLVDFGIAKTADSEADTKIGTVKGKVAYMAPEQAQGLSVDRRADLFAVGVILWELLAGRRLWEGLTEVAVVAHLVEGEIPELARLIPDLPPGLSEITSQALCADPGGRPASARQFQERLELIFDGLEPRLSTRGLGEIMRKEFQDDRVHSRAVLRKQLVRLRDQNEPAGVVQSSSDFRASVSQHFYGELPVLGEGSVVHSAVTTIGTDGERVQGRNANTTSAYSVTSLTDAALLSQSRNITWVALAAVGVAGLALGTTQPWRSNDVANPSVSALAAAPAMGATAEGDLGRGPAAGSSRNFLSSCSAADKDLVELTGEIGRDANLTCDKDYLLRFTTTVKAGATLKIQAGTVLRGDIDTRGTLVVQPGGRIEAKGQADAPIVFTSSAPEGRRSPGDWGGVIILGHAPLNLRNVEGLRTKGIVEGITRGGEYGGANAQDSSGELSYVRIEYSGTELAPNNEINGLTLGGVGRGTVIHHVQVRHTADDCFEFFGGTVDAKYLVCQQPGDDAFDWDYGYTGRLQFLVAQSDPALRSGDNGLEGDNDPNGSLNAPISSPSIYNFTLCGKQRSMTNQEHFGLLLRRASQVRIRNGIFMGFDAGIDLRDPASRLNIAASVFFDNSMHNLAYPETREKGAQGENFVDDDENFNEVAYLENEGLRISQKDPKIRDCFSLRAPDFKPDEALVSEAAIPPNDGFFDPKARYVGAFRDAQDDWDRGNWIKWDD